jgi:hypothetical protein
MTDSCDGRSDSKKFLTLFAVILIENTRARTSEHLLSESNLVYAGFSMHENAGTRSAPPSRASLFLNGCNRTTVA